MASEKWGKPPMRHATGAAYVEAPPLGSRFRKVQEMSKAPMPRPALPPKAPPPKLVLVPKTRAQLTLDQERMDKRDRAILKLGIFQGKVERKALSWMSAARVAGEAYKIADNNYKETLQKKTASDALEVQIFFSVLTVATSGALGWLSVVAAKATAGMETALKDSIEATLQATAGEVFSANGPLLFPPSGDSTVSQDPQVYQDELENKVDALHMDVLQAFIKVRQGYLDAPLEAWDRYDEATEAAAHTEWQNKAADFAGKDDLPNMLWMARELERGRWARYVLDNHSYRDFGIFQTADTPDDVGSDVRARLEKLGVTQAHLGPEYNRMGAPVNNVGMMVKKLWDWAQNYKVRSFAEEKTHPKGGGPDHQ
jgi:hypothetical protein